MGNKNIAIRGRQSFNTAGNEVLWEIDGVIYINPPVLYANQVKYVEVLSGLAATNKYGSEGAAGVIVVKTNVSEQKFNSRKNLWNRSRYSIPFFLHPRLEMPLNCIDSCVDDDNPKGFEDITAGDFLYQRLVDLGLVKD